MHVVITIHLLMALYKHIDIRGVLCASNIYGIRPIPRNRCVSQCPCKYVASHISYMEAPVFSRFLLSEAFFSVEMKDA